MAQETLKIQLSLIQKIQMLKIITKSLTDKSFRRIFNLMPMNLNHFCTGSPKQNFVSLGTHKLAYGQGGTVEFDLKNRQQTLYNIQFQTIWEDYCLLQILKSKDYEQNVQFHSILKVHQKDNTATVSDKNQLQSNIGQYKRKQDDQVKQKIVKLNFKIPQDYTFHGHINGSITHKKNNVSQKLRCNTTSLTLPKKKSIFQFGSIQCPSFNLDIPNGAVDIQNITFQNANFNCFSFYSAKVLFSGRLDLKAKDLIYIRSVVTYGQAVASIEGRNIQVQSISGKFNMNASERVKIDRIWASPKGINIVAKKIQKVGIETGTGQIKSQQPIKDGAITLGRLHKGKILKISQNRVVVQ